MATWRCFGIDIGLELLYISHLMLLAFIQVRLVDHLLLAHVTAITFIVTTIALLLDLPEPLIYLFLSEAELLRKFQTLGSSRHLATILLIHFAQNVHLLRLLPQSLKLLLAFAEDWCGYLLIVTALRSEGGHALLFDNFLFFVGVDHHQLLCVNFLLGGPSAEFQI